MSRPAQHRSASDATASPTARAGSHPPAAEGGAARAEPLGPPGPQDESGQARPSLRRERWSRVLWVALALDLALATWILVTGGVKVREPFHLSLTGADRPIGLALALAVAAAWLDARLRARLAGLLAPIGARWRATGLARQAGMLACALTLFFNGRAWLGVPDTARYQLDRAANVVAATGLFTNGAQPHLERLMAEVARRESNGPLAIYICYDDRRGHLAAFYAYPRLLLMEPGLRAWSLQSRMDVPGVADPLFALPRPLPALDELQASRAFALARRVPLLEVSETGPRLTPPPEGE